MICDSAIISESSISNCKFNQTSQCRSARVLCSCYRSEGLRRSVTVCLRKSQSQSLRLTVCLGVEPTLWTFAQILLPFQEVGSGICCPASVGSPLLRERRSVLVSHSLAICLCAHLLFTCLWFTHLSYTGYPRRNVPDFGRVFLRVKYTTQTPLSKVERLRK
jgi:hypothetical protein